MKRFVVIAVVIIFLTIVICTTALQERRGQMLISFSQSTAASADARAHYADLAKKLDDYLIANGFTPAEAPALVSVDVTYSRQTEDWYVTNRDGSPLYVMIHQPQGNASGLEAYVWYDVKTWRWKIDDMEADAQTIAIELDKWWRDNKTLQWTGDASD